MAERKTQKKDSSVVLFLNQIENEKKRRDAFAIHQMMQQATGEEPAMWGDSIIGYGSYHYKYKSGREGDWFVTGFSPRKQNFSIYLMSDFGRYQELLDRLGKHKTSKACLYINKLEDVDMNVLRELMSQSVKHKVSKT